MHKWAKSMADSLKAKVDELGVSNIDGEVLCDLEKWSKVIANIAQFDKDYKIIEAMEDAEAEDIVDMADERRYYRGQPRTRSGRFKKMYTGDMYYPDRDMDADTGRMYYGGGRRYYGEDGMMMPNGDRDTTKYGYYGTDRMSPESTMGRHYDHRMGKSAMSRRTYMESKDMNKDNEKKMKDLDKYLDELKEDMKEMVQGMTSDEKIMWQNRLNNMANSL